MSKREIDRLVDSGLLYEVVEGSSIGEPYPAQEDGTSVIVDGKVVPDKGDK